MKNLLLVILVVLAANAMGQINERHWDAVHLDSNEIIQLVRENKITLDEGDGRYNHLLYYNISLDKWEEPTTDKIIYSSINITLQDLIDWKEYCYNDSTFTSKFKWVTETGYNRSAAVQTQKSHKEWTHKEPIMGKEFIEWILKRKKK